MFESLKCELVSSPGEVQLEEFQILRVEDCRNQVVKVLRTELLIGLDVNVKRLQISGLQKSDHWDQLVGCDVRAG